LGSNSSTIELHPLTAPIMAVADAGRNALTSPP
jgi:hypothetical protein